MNLFTKNLPFEKNDKDFWAVMTIIFFIAGVCGYFIPFVGIFFCQPLVFFFGRWTQRKDFEIEKKYEFDKNI